MPEKEMNNLSTKKKKKKIYIYIYPADRVPRAVSTIMAEMHYIYGSGNTIRSDDLGEPCKLQTEGASVEDQNRGLVRRNGDSLE